MSSPVTPDNQPGDLLLRLVDADYGDGIGAMAGADRLSAREISNIVFSQSETTGNAADISNFMWMWGQFLDHDLSLSDPHVEAGTADIAVAAGDPMFDPTGTGEATIGFTRTEYHHDTGVTGPREQMNMITPFIDGSNVYGSDATRLAALRNDDGTMKTSEGDLLPYNVDGLPNAHSTSASQFLAGDIRANENVGLTSMHTVFVREHNRLVSEMDDSLTGDQKFDAARAQVEAQLQAITYNEFLPKLIGPDALGEAQGFDADVDPQIANVFSTAAFRVGHTMLPTDVLRMNEDGTESALGNLQLREAFFRPDKLGGSEGIDAVLRGAAASEAEEVDSQIVDDVRNFLFGRPGSGGFDLAALNIQRGRDHGIDDYNTVRAAFGLEPATSFADISSDPAVQAQLEAAYGTVDDMDLFVAGLAEDAVEGGLVGETFATIIADQFTRLRDGDETFDATASTDTLADIIMRNTGIENLQDDVFTAVDRADLGTQTETTEPEPIIMDGPTTEGGTDGDDVIVGSNSATPDVIFAGGGDDKVYGGDGGDRIDSGSGDDLLIGEGGADTLFGGTGNDHLFGNDDDDILFGDVGNDVLIGGNGNDTFVFSVGDDVVLDFNKWTDTIDVSQSGSVQVSQFETGALLTSAAGDTLWLSGVATMDHVEFIEEPLEDELV